MPSAESPYGLNTFDLVVMNHVIEHHTTPIGDNSIVYEMDEMSALDIDSELDFKIMKILMKERN